MSCPMIPIRVSIVTIAVLLALLLTTFTHTPRAEASTLNTEVIASINVTFGAYAPQALRVAYCESGYNPFAYNRSSGASGVFQIIPGTWRGTSRAWSSPFSTWANVAAAHEIFVRDGNSWREWTCKPW